ncbi:hypothetical protein ANCDUO_20147 [Ancylostoma duodenale]|uniref:Uncharacterized protein n=1 Tax=Ancylostoma duodenale TaxID=51022 RepID=A0A0C2CJ05_9BILA|nr:hypothetical protein ANCDUO_20147 [Ancylostoma duodenale]
MEIPGSAHHLDLRTPNTCDPNTIQNARFQVCLGGSNVIFLPGDTPDHMRTGSTRRAKVRATGR